MGLQHTKFTVQFYNTTTMETRSFTENIMICNIEKAADHYLSWQYIHKKYPDWDISHKIIVRCGFVTSDVYMLGDPDSETYYVSYSLNETAKTITFKVFEAETTTKEYTFPLDAKD